MTLDFIKNRIYQELEVLFDCVAVDEMAGDTQAYQDKLKIVADVADVLGLEMKVSIFTLDLKN